MQIKKDRNDITNNLPATASMKRINLIIVIFSKLRLAFDDAPSNLRNETTRLIITV